MTKVSALAVGVYRGANTVLKARECFGSAHCARLRRWHRVVFDSSLPMQLVDIAHAASKLDDTGDDYAGRQCACSCVC